jgi:uncharacterized protein (DUF983 family)
MKKGSKLYSIIFQKCPRCHEGELFTERNPYKFSKIFEMPERCEKCGQKYQLEPSFFYGSMYVNYGLTVAISVATFVAMRVSAEWQLFEYFIGIMIAILLFAPFTFRIGRGIWINMFVSYDPEATKDKN